MKYKNILNFLLLSASVVLVLSSCKKPGEVEEALNSGKSTLRFAQTTNDGNFLTQLYVPDLSVDADTLSLSDLQLKLEGPKTAPADIAVEYKVNLDAIARYNQAHASDPGFEPFIILPADAYAIINKNDIIKKGEVYGSGLGKNIKFNTQKINTTVNYILPISITSPDYPTATGTGTVLIYLIGNPISGGYTWDFTRYNNADGSGAPNSLSFTGESTVFVPVDATTVEVQSGYYIGPRYVITFKDNNGTLSDFNVKLHPADVKAMSDGGVEIASGPRIVQADPVLGVYVFEYVAVSGGSAYRFIRDKYYK